jgi:hypothetical protein
LFTGAATLGHTIEEANKRLVREGLFSLVRSVPATLRYEPGLVLAEHWDVLQDEATREESQSGRPMFGSDFPQ